MTPPNTSMVSAPPSTIVIPHSRATPPLAFRLALVLFGFVVGAASAAPPALPTLRVVGPPETVIAAEDMHCRPPAGEKGIDVPDMPPAAYRRADGTVVMLASNRHNFAATGPSLDGVKRRACDSVLPSQGRAEPEAFADNQWLTSVYAVSPSLLLGFVHDEYHGDEHGLPNCETTSKANYECWYASTTLVVSSDDGRSFKRAPGDDVIAALPYRFKPGAKRAGVSSPKVVGDPNGEYLYLFVTFMDRNRGIRTNECLLRAAVREPTKWLGWDGKAFAARIGNPYGERSPDDCVSVIRGVVTGVKYLPRYQAYVAISLDGNEVKYQFSRDAINWDAPRPLPFDFVSLGSYHRGDPQPLAYFTILDPTSRSRNFDTIEDKPYLYYVRWRTDGRGIVNSRRDVMRLPLAFE